MATERKAVVLVSRLWKNPHIAVGVSEDGISIALGLEAFLAALANEIGNPARMLTTAQLTARIQDAGARVVDSMKAETARVI